MTDDRAVYVISVAAELAGVHPQTLRIYERKGLLRPKRTAGNSRRYSERDIERLREIHDLTQEQGINLAGVKLITEMQVELDALRAKLDRLERDLTSRWASGADDADVERIVGADPAAEIVEDVPLATDQRPVAGDQVSVAFEPPGGPAARPDDVDRLVGRHGPEDQVVAGGRDACRRNKRCVAAEGRHQVRTFGRDVQASCPGRQGRPGPQRAQSKRGGCQ